MVHIQLIHYYMGAIIMYAFVIVVAISSVIFFNRKEKSNE